ncbi:MAG TPA: Holliday junction branch migration protein RuvA [Candidatus Bathyarchaeia archaeon]|nr:Holliday junction branch migration protein RuvA [Candidatus Bathyarchaeia archaeon]
MIGRLHGKLAHKTPGSALVDVGGVGYEVSVSLQAFARLPAVGAPVVLEIVTHLRADALALYGFIDETEKAMFGWLCAVNGVGPKLALNVLSGIPGRDLRSALAAGDVDRLRLVPGVGKKTAERLVLELRERASLAEAATRDGAEHPAPSTRNEEAISALTNLGYRRSDAERVLGGIAADVSLEEAIREALRRFAR